jgi:hypothetical protein
MRAKVFANDLEHGGLSSPGSTREHDANARFMAFERTSAVRGLDRHALLSSKVWTGLKHAATGSLVSRFSSGSKGLLACSVTTGRHLIHDPAGMVVKNFVFVILMWVAAGQSGT